MIEMTVRTSERPAGAIVKVGEAEVNTQEQGEKERDEGRPPCI